MKLLLLLSATLLSLNAEAVTDYQCQSDCLQSGRSLGLCERQCSFDDYDTQAKKQLKQNQDSMQTMPKIIPNSSKLHDYNNY